MNEGLIQGVTTMRAAEKRLETIAANLANVDSNGFKRTTATIREFERVLRGRTEREISTKLQHNFSQGALRSTGQPYDLALAGEGFFTIEGANGEMYTRDGRFFVDDKGVLQTFEGLPVVWDGARGAIDPAGNTVTVDAEGTVRQGQTQVGKLRLADFEDKTALTVDSRGFFIAQPSAVPKAFVGQVRQGNLELSNVSSVEEMVALIAVQRQFEAGARVMSSIDQTYRRLTSPR